MFSFLLREKGSFKLCSSSDWFGVIREIQNDLLIVNAKHFLVVCGGYESL